MAELSKTRLTVFYSIIQHFTVTYSTLQYFTVTHFTNNITIIIQFQQKTIIFKIKPYKQKSILTKKYTHIKYLKKPKPCPKTNQKN